MLTLVLTRHGLTDRSSPEQHLGQRIDVSINEAGRRQAEALARRLAPVRFDRVFTSPLFRARETAAIVARGVEVEADPRLRGDGLRRVGGPDVRADRARPTGPSGDAWERDPDRLAVPRRRVRRTTSPSASAASSATCSTSTGRGTRRRRSARRPRAGAPRPPASSGRSSPSPTPRPTGSCVCVALGIEVREFRERLTQDQANLTVLRWELEAAPDEERMLVAQRHAPTCAGRRGALVLGAGRGARAAATSFGRASPCAACRACPSRHHSSTRRTAR